MLSELVWLTLSGVKLSWVKLCGPQFWNCNTDVN